MSTPNVPLVGRAKVFSLHTDKHRRMSVSVVCTACGAAAERRVPRAQMPPGVVSKWFKNLGWEINAKFTKAKCPSCLAAATGVPVPKGPPSEPHPPLAAVPDDSALPPKGQATVVTVTPLMAMHLLDKNERNRGVTWSHVVELAHEMETNWKLNGDTIRIGQSGHVLDGQHRLHACVMADRSFVTYMLTGLPDDVHDTIDIGKKRTAGNVLEIAKEKNSTATAGALRLLRDILTGNIAARSGKRLDVLAWLAAHPEIRASVDATHKYRPVFRSRALASALHYILAQIPDSDADWFIDSLVSGANLGPNDPVYLLRNRLIEGTPRYGRRHEAAVRDTTAETIALVLRTWESWKRGKRLIKIQASTKPPQEVVAAFIQRYNLGTLPTP